MERDFSGITKLVMAASKAHVRKLVVGDIVVEFDSATIEPEQAAFTLTETSGSGDNKVTFNYEVSPEQEAEIRAMQQEELLITDPLEYERLQMENR